MTACECDRYRYANTPCSNQAEDHGTVICSPALCIACLFLCFADEEDD